MLKKRYSVGLAVVGVVVISLITAFFGPKLVEKETHCYAMLSPVDTNSKDFSNVLESGCFDSFAESIQAATDGKVFLDPKLDPKDLTEEMINPEGASSIIAPDTITVIGIDYKNASFGGSSYTWTITGVGCTDSISFGVGSMPSGWDNVVSSARSYANCNHYYHWENQHNSGVVLDCVTSCATMGVMNDQTSSEQWHK